MTISDADRAYYDALPWPDNPQEIRLPFLRDSAVRLQEAHGLSAGSTMRIVRAAQLIAVEHRAATAEVVDMVAGICRRLAIPPDRLSMAAAPGRTLAEPLQAALKLHDAGDTVENAITAAVSATAYAETP